MSHWGRNNKSFYNSRLSAYNKCAHAVSLKIGLAIMNGVHSQIQYHRSLDTRIYKTDIQFWAVLSSWVCREKKKLNCHKSRSKILVVLA